MTDDVDITYDFT